MTGFIDQMSSKERATNGSAVKRIVLNNNSGKRVTIVTWGEEAIKKLDPICQAGNVSNLKLLIF